MKLVVCTTLAITGVLGLASSASIATPSTATEKPSAVSDALRERFGDDTVIDGVELRLVLGLPVYHVSLHEGGRDLLVQVSDSGEVLTVRSPGRLELLPESAREALPKALRKRDIRVWRVELLHTIDGKSSPRVRHLIEVGDSTWLFNADGQLLAEFPGAGPTIAAEQTEVPAQRNEQPTAAPVDARAPQVMRIADVRRGQAVVLRGEVRRIRDSDEFILADDSGQIEIYIGWQNDMPVTRGQTVTVHGRADDSALPGFRPDIYARRIVMPDGRTIELR